MAAPELDRILPSRNIPDVFMWGELDELQSSLYRSGLGLIEAALNQQQKTQSNAVI
jgi:hypothetical protein